jgi:cyclophilin family peptidyl-prolyl cis-trans isomerase
MLRFLLTVGVATVMALTSAPPLRAQASKAATKTPAGPTVVLETSKGTIEIETLPGDAPKSVARFLELAKSSFYRQQRFHWVQSNLIQAGDPLSRDMSKMEKWGTGGSGPRFTPRPIGVAETSKRPFTRGIVGLAYLTGRRPDSADSQFFILKGPSPNLDGKYAVIGRVTKGMDVVDKIEKLDVIKMVTVR